MQKADLTGYGRTTGPMANWSGESTTITARGTGTGNGTGAMAHWSGDITSTTE